MKIAVTSSDGKTVDKHFGEANQFLIFQMGKGGLEFLEIREKSSEPVYDHEYRWKRGFKLIKDCKVIFCRRVGDEPREEFHKLGIEVVESKNETIPVAITGYLASIIQEIKSDNTLECNNLDDKNVSDSIKDK
jgi:predicted Fe-Mo cluster-binding NifX family protein